MASVFFSIVDLSGAFRLSRFYGWSLEDTLSLPVGVAIKAAEEKRQIEYEEFCRDIAIECAPSMKANDRKRLIQKAKPPQVQPERVVIEHNPEKAKAFFRSMGAIVHE